MATGTIRILTPVQRQVVWAAIMAKMDGEDREPHDVINDPAGPFYGDENHYLNAMAVWHQIDLDAITEGQE